MCLLVATDAGVSSAVRFESDVSQVKHTGDYAEQVLQIQVGAKELTVHQSVLYSILFHELQ